MTMTDIFVNYTIKGNWIFCWCLIRSIPWKFLEIKDRSKRTAYHTLLSSPICPMCRKTSLLAGLVLFSYVFSRMLSVTIQHRFVTIINMKTTCTVKRQYICIFFVLLCCLCNTLKQLFTSVAYEKDFLKQKEKELFV